jgi:hypothetical protein
LRLSATDFALFESGLRFLKSRFGGNQTVINQTGPRLFGGQLVLKPIELDERIRLGVQFLCRRIFQLFLQLMLARFEIFRLLIDGLLLR